MAAKIITLEDIKKNEDISTLVNAANRSLEAIGYTDHGPRHVGYVSRVASDILKDLGYEKRQVELAAIAGWVHDIGNVVNRKSHGISGATILFSLLRDMEMPMSEIAEIVMAVGNHEEQNGNPVSPISAALIIADKIDAHRTRVRSGKYDPSDIHDRVNYSIKKTSVVTDREKGEIRYEFQMDETSSAMEFMTLYNSRMIMSERACGYLGCIFCIVVNGVLINGHPQSPNPQRYPIKKNGQTK
ncbi:MAG: HD domain-containing protein [Christensenellales bacterium]|jgi:metal-dependent HD superfamily phosphatase/phosphodiesterase